MCCNIASADCWGWCVAAKDRKAPCTDDKPDEYLHYYDINTRGTEASFESLVSLTVLQLT